MQQETLFSDWYAPPPRRFAMTHLFNNAMLINQTSGNVEYYTPAFIIEAARAVLGCIDLDPASSPAANAVVKATNFYTQVDDGMAQSWHGNVWMNHPFSREENALWIDKLCAEYERGEVTQACCITFAATSEAWFQPLFSYPLCFLSPRTNYVTPTGDIKQGVTKGSVVAYLGANIVGFLREFQPLGRLMLPALLVNATEINRWYSHGGVSW